MPESHIHIISFDIPYPPNYGGVIDVFYKIRALYELGVKVHLHCFEYGREQSPRLAEYCYEVNYYRRELGLKAALSYKPFIVSSRSSPQLIGNLQKDDHPILFEGLHTCFFLGDKRLRHRIKIYRESNIEHQYYFHLFKAEKNIFKKLFFLSESLKLRLYQKQLRYSNLMLTVSRKDHDYLSGKFPLVDVKYLPSFHGDDDVNILSGKGNYVLYHGNLGVPENIKAAEYLLGNIFPRLPGIAFVIAGLNPPRRLIRLALRSPDTKLIINPGEEELQKLIHNAHINIMITFQPTGLKLKLMKALFGGRFCLVNPEMVEGTDLAVLCETGRTPEEFREKILELMKHPFDESMINDRKNKLAEHHSNRKNCKTLLNLIPLYDQ